MSGNPAGNAMAEKKLVIKKKKYQGSTEVVSARLPHSMVIDLDKVAELTGYNRNEVVSMCLEFALQNIVTDDGK